MLRSLLGKAGPVAVLLALGMLLIVPPAQGGTGGFMGGLGGLPICCDTGGFGGFTGGFGGIQLGGSGGSATAAVPQPTSLLLIVIGLGGAAWGVWRNRH